MSRRKRPVIVVSLVSERGTRYSSVEKEYKDKSVGYIEEGPDEVGCYGVRFRGVEGLMWLHRSILKDIVER